MLREEQSRMMEERIEMLKEQLEGERRAYDGKVTITSHIFLLAHIVAAAVFFLRWTLFLPS